MKRNRSTHVRKFGGVWYQLVRLRENIVPWYDVCGGCCLEHDMTLCAEGFDCQRDVVFDIGGIWKEVGQI